MVKVVATAADRQILKKALPQVVVELVGPAGAGKTTLAKALSQYDRKVLIGPDIELRKIKHIPIFVRTFPYSMPVILGGGQPGSQFGWNELKYVAYLKGWPRLLSHQVSNRGKVILLDHGPVFRLTSLLEFGPEKLRNTAFDPWWNTLYKQWAYALDMIVWLDASDATLIERINARDQLHGMKGKSSSEAQQFLQRYRMSYLHTLRKLKVYKDPLILAFDTDKTSIEQISFEILRICNSKLSGQFL